MESKEFSLLAFAEQVAKAFQEECFITPKYVNVSMLHGSHVYIDHDLVIAKIPSGFVLFPSVVSKLKEFGLSTIGLSSDKNFFELIFDCK